jgi:hypothetical protein
MLKKYPAPTPENLPITVHFSTVEEQAKNIAAALEIANETWATHPEAADYTITIKIMGVDYPLFINAIDVVEPLYNAIDDIISIAAEQQW